MKHTIFGILVAIIGILGSLWLLLHQNNKISGAEFVVLSLGFTVIAIIICFSKEVQEFSIAGNSVKLKELRIEAEKTIEELKEARTELFRILFQKSIAFSGGWGSDSKVDERVNSFISLFNQVEKFNCLKELKLDVSKALNVLMVSQFNQLKFIHLVEKRKGDVFSHIDRPDTLWIKLNDSMIESQRLKTRINQQHPEFSVVKEDIVNGIHAYAKLYQIKIKLDKLELNNV